ALGQHAHYIAQYAELVQPLAALRAKGAVFVWGREQREAFDAIRRAVAEYVSVPWTHGAPTRVRTNCSGKVLAGVIEQHVAQGGHDVDWRLVAAYGRALTPAERLYSPTTRETLALHAMVEKFGYWLQDTETPFTWMVDNLPAVGAVQHKTKLS